MSYLDLANLLETLAKTLTDNHDKLDGAPLAKAASGLQKSAVKFEATLEDFLSGSDPLIRELEGILKTPAKLLPLDRLNLASRDVFGSILMAAKLPSARKEFLARAKKEQAAERALNSVKQLLMKSSEPLPTDKVALQNELLRLGGLSDEELKWEFARRLNTIASLKSIAEANSLPVSKRATKGALIETITHYARRAHANVAHRA
jgi:hypothetical protein